MSIIRQHEAIIACASVVPRDVDAVMHTPTIVVIITLVHVCKTKNILYIHAFIFHTLYFNCLVLRSLHTNQGTITLVYMDAVYLLSASKGASL